MGRDARSSLVPADAKTRWVTFSKIEVVAASRVELLDDQPHEPDSTVIDEFLSGPCQRDYSSIGGSPDSHVQHYRPLETDGRNLGRQIDLTV